VIVGAVASTGGQAYLEKKREEREDDRAKRLVAGELLHLQMVFRVASAGMSWLPIEDINAFLPNSAWQEHRARLSVTVDEDLWDQLVMAYGLLEIDRMRFVMGSALPPDRKLTESEAASLRQTGYHLGRLRRRLGDGGGGWLDDIVEEQAESFMEWFDGLSDDDLRNDAVVVQVRQIANALASEKHDDGGAWLAAINQRLEMVDADRQ
jgi:hypothetical protein